MYYQAITPYAGRRVFAPNAPPQRGLSGMQLPDMTPGAIIVGIMLVAALGYALFTKGKDD